jgi:hypothetical protein
LPAERANDPSQQEPVPLPAMPLGLHPMNKRWKE